MLRSVWMILARMIEFHTGHGLAAWVDEGRKCAHG